jgi:hypothetical protein
MLRIPTVLLLVSSLLACGNNAGAVSDAGNADAGTPDAGTVDAGAPDAGQGDAGAADAGIPDAGPPPVILTGTLMAGPGPAPGNYAGVHYRAGSQSGYTDAAGTFQYPLGSQISFSVGGLTLGTVAGAARITPFTLSGGCTITPLLTALLVFLQSLDTDSDPRNGVQLAQFPAVLTGSLASLNPTQLATDISQLIPGRTPVSNQSALDQFIAQVDGEAWTQASMDTFSLLAGGARSQGGASDGTSWYFSWRFGLQRTDASFNVQKQSLYEIPPAIALQGSNHIGDIDYFSQVIFTGIEDSAHYAHPYIAQFDAMSLNNLNYFPVDVTVQPDGVPWVAYDSVHEQVLSSAWSHPPGINFFDANNSMSLVKTVITSPGLDRIQGAKMYRGFLYAAMDVTPDKIIYKINLDTGTALIVLSMDLGTVEQEGLIFQERSDGTAMHTLNANSGTTGIDFRHHTRTRLPLRDSICP